MSQWTPLLLPASVSASFLSLPATLIESALVLADYTLYAIEQRLTARDPLALVIVLTGQTPDTVTVDRFRIDAPEEQVRSLFPSERLVTTVHGLMPVTSLSALPSSVSLVQLPSGSYANHKDALYEAIALRRLGLSGRSALTLSPSQAALSNFRAMFKLKPFAILDLIAATQSALALFNMFERQPDGLLCDDTLEAVSCFYEDVAEPLDLLTDQRNDDSLTPALFSVLISSVLAAKNRLLVLGVNVPKDPIRHLKSFSRAIASACPDSTPYLSANTCRFLASKASTKRENDLPLSRLLPTHSTRASDVSETNDIDKLIDMLRKDGCRLSRLWTDNDEGLSSGSMSSNESEDGPIERRHARKRSRRILRGVRTTVGKAGKRLGDNFGLTSTGDHAKPTLSRQSSMTDLRKSASSQTGRHSALGRSIDLTGPGGRPQALKTYRMASEAFLDVHRQSQPMQKASSLEPDSLALRQEDDQEHPDSEIDGDTQRSDSRTGEAKTLMRRHSFNILDNAPLPASNASMKRLEVEVSLRSLAMALHTREKALEELADSMQIMHDSYQAAIASLEPTVRERTTKLEHAIREGEKIISRTAQPPPALVELSSVTNKLRFARSGAETSLAELTSALRGLDRVRAGSPPPPGQTRTVQTALEKDLSQLQHEQRRVRRLYRVASLWRDWLLGGLWLSRSTPKEARTVEQQTS